MLPPQGARRVRPGHDAAYQVGALARPLPDPKSAGGHLVPENVRLSHTWCNNRDYGWRMQIRTLLTKGKSLAEIAETLNRRNVLPAHGTNRWTATMVRKAYVS